MRDLSIVNFSRGEIIFREGEPSDSLYFILNPPDADGTGSQEDGESGQRLEEECKLTWETEHGGEDDAEGALAFVPAGQVFGEEGLVYRYRSLAS